MALLTAAQTNAEIKRKAAAGIALTNTSNAANNAAYKSAIPAVSTNQSPVPTATKVTTPSVTTPKMATTAVAAPTASISAEIQRKAAAGIPLTNTTNAANNAAYKAAVPQMKTSTPTAVQAPASSPVSAPTTAAAPTTNYVTKGGQTLNDILYLKKQYESGKTGAAAYATPSYSKLDPTLASKVKGMNAAQLEAYINGQNGQSNNSYAPEETAAVETAVYDPYAEARALYEREQAAMDAAAGVNDKEIVRRAAYSNGVTNDNRAVQDYVFNQNNAPADRDRSTNFRAAQQDRSRNIEDHYTQEGLTDARAAAWSQANAFRDQSGNYLTTKSAELDRAEKQYNLQLAGLTGVINGQQTMQGASNAASLVSQNLANQMAQIDLSTYPETSKLQLQQLQQQVKAGSISNDTAAYQFSQLTDPNSATNQAQALDLKMKQIDASSYSETQKLQLEQLRKTVAEIGKTPYQSDADARLDQLRVLTAEAELDKLQETAAAPAGKTYEDYQSAIEKIANRDDKTKALKNPDTVEEYILNSDMSEYEMYRAYRANGLTWGGTIPTKGE